MNWLLTRFHGYLRRLRFRRWQLLILGVAAWGMVTMGAIASDPFQQAQQLNTQGQQALTAGQPEAALDYWQQAEDQYQNANDQLGIWGSQLNQAKALQTLGFYRRAQAQLSQLTTALTDEAASLLKVNVWLTHGQGLRLLGELPDSQIYLEQALTMAQQLGDSTHQQTAHLYLGNTLAAQQQWSEARTQYDQAATIDGPIQLTAQLRQLQTLPHLNRAAEIRPQAQTFVQQVFQETSGTTRMQLTLDLTQWLLQYSPETLSDLSPETLLPTAIQQAQLLTDRRLESYGWGYLGHWHEQQQQWSTAAQETQTALILAQTLNADELLYQWQWQQGRIAKAQGKTQRAIDHYSAAVESLQNLRQEIVAITRDIQFSFRSQVEPVYRDLVDLLLSPATLEGKSHEDTQAALEQARQVLENLQLAELNNFFSEPCIESIPQSLDTLDPKAAILYPIILPDRLAVILSIPGQPLHYASTNLPQVTIEAGIQQMLDSMRITSFRQERLTAAAQLYQWLVEPVETVLKTSNVQTLTFVMDDALRSLPIAALYDNSHYLIENYRLAISPGLQLLQINDTQIEYAKLTALVGGLSTSKDNRPPLVGVKQEVNHIEQLLDAQVLLDNTFTTAALIEQSQQKSFDIVHLATHAQFGATNAETFIETWDGTLQINQLRQLLRQQEIQGIPPTLLVLSACDTAQGSTQAVLGMAGLAVRSGAQTTLATLWSVNDQATATFIQQFYDGLVNQGLTKARAIQYAQQQLIQTPAFQHPFYWAPFVLVGNWL